MKHNHGLDLWLAKRNRLPSVRLNALNTTRHYMRQQFTDLAPRGHGNRARRRAYVLDHAPGTLLWPDYAL